jgi:hypothetical protein
MSAANVRFDSFDALSCEVGKEQTFGFDCPRRKNGRCEGLIILGRTKLPHDPQSQNGGIAQWTWDGNRGAPTFTPSINCGTCGWHGHIQKGRCVDTSRRDEPEPK